MVYIVAEVFMQTTNKPPFSKRDPVKSKARMQSKGRTPQKPETGGGEYYRVKVKHTVDCQVV